MTSTRHIKNTNAGVLLSSVCSARDPCAKALQRVPLLRVTPPLLPCFLSHSSSCTINKAEKAQKKKKKLKKKKEKKNTNAAKLPCLSTTSLTAAGETKIKRQCRNNTDFPPSQYLVRSIDYGAIHYNKLLFERILNGKRYLKRNTRVELNSQCAHTVKLRL